MIIGMFDLYIYMYIKYVTFYLNKSKIFIKVLALKLYFRNNFCKWKKSRFFTDFLKDFTLLSTFTSSEEACVFLAGTRPYFLIIITIKLHLIHWVTQTLCEHKTLKKKPQGLWEQQVSGRSVQRFSKGAHHLSPDRLLLRSSREWDGLCQRTRFHQVWLPFSSLSFHFSSHCALKFHALLFCSRCRLLWAAPPSAGHSSLYVSQDFPVWGHAIWLLVCTVCIGDMCCGCFLRSSFICMYSPNNRIKKKMRLIFLFLTKLNPVKD